MKIIISGKEYKIHTMFIGSRAEACKVLHLVEKT